MVNYEKFMIDRSLKELDSQNKELASLKSELSSAKTESWKKHYRSSIEFQEYAIASKKEDIADYNEMLRKFENSQ